ncbi:MAG: DUF3795 domain-containing protein [Methanomassiliicoccales archaeon]|nr:DUF3795 domain-containing protein [Methanomassiliicoccales archaeon]
MKIGVCGIACEICPLMVKEKCPNGEKGCTPKMNEFCRVSTCAFERGVRYCFECPDFPCETTRSGPISHEYCMFISGKWKP